MDKMINVQFQMQNATCIVYIVFHGFSKYPQALELSTKTVSMLLVRVCDPHCLSSTWWQSSFVLGWQLQPEID